ncbi:MAG TPA: quinolinate synthase NadA [Candidatus Hydrogenedentes bacterium]|nr:quinolinate synthase NadA [Candidatus Hydrogenedentota bacterium]
MTVAVTARIQDAESVEETLARMKERLGGIVPEAELPRKAELVFQIHQLKRERNACILGHNYMEPALFHSIPDYVGDSLQLSRICTRTNADIILFCGVLFMAETAKVLNSDKTVLIPSENAGCSLAEGITPDDIRRLKRVYPDAPVITYVNTYADAKAESDCCCTSGNAGPVVQYYFDQGHEAVIFLPDEFLAHNTANQLGADFLLAPADLDSATENLGLEPNKKTVIGWNIHCEVHGLFTPDHVRQARSRFDPVVILAHPECPPDVIELSDVAGSTKKMVDYIEAVDAPRYLLFTESAMADNMAVAYPHRDVVRYCDLRCQHMNTVTLENTLEALQKVQHKVELDPDVLARARAPIEKMLDIL